MLKKAKRTGMTIDDLFPSIASSAQHAAGKPITGTDKADVLNGSGGNDTINGKGGDDTIDGKEGDDTIYGGDGDDEIQGDDGYDHMYGGKGNDRLYLEDDGGVAHGGDGDDYFQIGGDATVWGDAGNDTFYTYQAGGSFVHGGDGRDIYRIEATGDSTPNTVKYSKGNMVITSYWKASDTLASDVEIIEIRGFGGSQAVDRTKPIAPSKTFAINEIGRISDRQSTHDATLKFAGQAGIYARVTLTLDGKVVATTTADESGSWSFNYASHPLGLGKHSLQVVADYGLGISSKADLFHFTVLKPVVQTHIDLASLTAAEGVILPGDKAHDWSGDAVANIGDINGDGFADFAIGASNALTNDMANGKAYVVFGTGGAFGKSSSGKQILDLAKLSATDGFTLDGFGALGSVGTSISGAGDVNGDGYDDIMIGSPDGRVDTDKDTATVLYGGNGGFGVASGQGRVVDLRAVTADQGFTIIGSKEASELGSTVALLGDINKDGFEDIAVDTYVLFGAKSGFGDIVDNKRVVDVSKLSTQDGFIFRGDSNNSSDSIEVTSAGDVNGDGIDDILIGNSRDNYNYGNAAIVFGTKHGFGEESYGHQVFTLWAMEKGQGVNLRGSGEITSFGQTVAALGDINGDGYDDIAIGAHRAKDNGKETGLVYVVFGKAGKWGVAGKNNGEDILAQDKITATRGFIVKSGDKDSSFGKALSSAGDFNGDGLDDFIIGAPYADSNKDGSGSAYVIYGSKGSFGTKSGDLQVLDTRVMSSKAGFELFGHTASSYAGHAVSSAGDVNGDGFDDLLIGAPRAVSGGEKSGISYILFGGQFGTSKTPVTTKGTSAAEIFTGGAGKDVLTGNGGKDVFHSGAGNDTIVVKDAGFKLIDGGLGDRDLVKIAGADVTLDARKFSNGQLTGIEAFDMTGTGKNKLILTDRDVFHLSTSSNSAFTAAASHNNLVVYGDAGDVLDLMDSGSHHWALSKTTVSLAGADNGDFDIYNLMDGTKVLASVAVDHDMTVL